MSDWNDLKNEVVECFANNDKSKRNLIRSNLGLPANGQVISWRLEEALEIASKLSGITVEDLIVNGLRTAIQRQISTKTTRPDSNMGVISAGFSKVQQYVERVEKETGKTPSVSAASQQTNTNYNSVKRWYLRYRPDKV